MPVSLVKNTPFDERDDLMNGRTILDPDPAGWSGVAVMEWELTRAEWTDRHPHDEVNYVLEGELRVECDGETVVAGVGDTVVVTAHSTGRYFAPVYARMLAVYGPNPHGEASDRFHYRRLDDPAP